MDDDKACPVCTYLNYSNATKCEICESELPTSNISNTNNKPEKQPTSTPPEDSHNNIIIETKQTTTKNQEEEEEEEEEELISSYTGNLTEGEETDHLGNSGEFNFEYTDLRNSSESANIEFDIYEYYEKYTDCTLDKLDSVGEFQLSINNIKEKTKLSDETLNAWGLGGEATLQVFLTNEFYAGGTSKAVTFRSDEVNKKANYRVKMQLDTILNMFLKDTFMTYESPSSSASKRPQSPDHLDYIPSHDDIHEIMDLGFDEDLARDALYIANGDRTSAIDMIFNTEKDVIHSNALALKEGQKVEEKEEEKTTKTKKGFIVRFVDYLLARLPLLYKHCVICDQPQLYGAIMLVPGVCNRDLCMWSYMELGVCSDADVSTYVEVIELLWVMAVRAACSPRRNIIFSPFPVLFDKNKQLILSESKKDFELVQTIIRSIPPKEGIVGDWKAYLEKAHELAYPLFQWVISSNTAYIIPLPKEKHLKSMKSERQFLMVTLSPDKQTFFEEQKARYGSSYGFHGSSIENWHSIIRRGLVNASEKKEFMMNGAAYGSGVYISESSGYSFGYSRCDASAEDKLNFRCLCICEIINHPQKLKRHNSIWTVLDERLVATRFFMVYPVNCKEYPNVLSSDGNFLQEITAARNVKIN